MVELLPEVGRHKLFVAFSRDFSITASFQRVGLANAAGVLDLAIDFADTFGALCHQLALLHR
jgi:hypothetical protein